MKLRAIPGRLWVAVVLLGLQTFGLGWTILAAGANVVNGVWFGLSVVFLLLLPGGHPLARQWGLYVAGLQLLSGALFTLFVLIGPTPASAVGLLMLGVGGLLWWGLSGESVRRYFGLYCSACGSYRTRARSFLFNRIGCRRCGREWKKGELLDPSIFE
ncbi:MAG: hypothetical protein ACYTDU_08085 [Planctomycetota bacterium]